jgi:ammonium transporter, Amt family
LLYGNSSQFVAEVIGVATNCIVIGTLGFIVFKLIDVTIGLRVKPAVEAEGLDMDEMGVPGYVGVVDNLGLPELSSHAPLGVAKALPAEGRS